jgi:hypothetical protein
MSNPHGEPGESVDLGAAVLTPGDEMALVDELTRSALVYAVPEEVGVFEKSREDFLERRGSVGHRAEDDVLGFGVEAVTLLTPYVVAAATAAVRLLAGLFLDAANTEAKTVVARWVSHLLHGDEADAAPPRAALPPDVALRVHDVTMSVCRDLGLDATDASLVSDTVTGRLLLPAA